MENIGENIAFIYHVALILLKGVTGESTPPPLSNLPLDNYLWHNYPSHVTPPLESFPFSRTDV